MTFDCIGECGRFGITLWPFYFVAVFVCVSFGVAILVCGRFGCHLVLTWVK